MKDVVRPPALLAGDTIGVVAPASNLKRDWFAAGVRELERLGFKVKYLDSIFEKGRFTAGSDRRRADEVNRMFADTEVKAIFAARGGYGSARILELLDNETISANPKIFMGYSDITTLLIFLYQKHNLVTFHGPMVAKDFRAGESHYDRYLLFRVLTRAEAAGEVNCAGTKILRSGVASGRLLGGCLPMITNSIGTEYELDTRGAILFIEDYDSKPYRIDRMLTHLRLAGKFNEVRGLIFGEMIDCIQHPDQGYTIDEVIEDCVGDLGIPVLFGLTAGHGELNNLTLPLGVEVTLDCERGKLTINEPAVVF